MPVAGHFLNGCSHGVEACGAGIYDRGAGTEFDPVLDHDVPVAKRWDRVAEPVAEHIAGLESRASGAKYMIWRWPGLNRFGLGRKSGGSYWYRSSTERNQATWSRWTAGSSPARAWFN